jgi:hypothetical protein
MHAHTYPTKLEKNQMLHIIENHVPYYLFVCTAAVDRCIKILGSPATSKSRTTPTSMHTSPKHIQAPCQEPTPVQLSTGERQRSLPQSSLISSTLLIIEPIAPDP